jgi:hypothetical protein
MIDARAVGAGLYCPEIDTGLRAMVRTWLESIPYSPSLPSTRR